MRHILIALALATVPVVAWVPDAAAQTTADAQALFERGNEHLRRGLAARSARVRRQQLQQASRLYHETLRIARSRSVLYNLAYCYEQLGRLEDAYAYYAEYLGFEDLTQTDRAEAERRLAAIEPRVALVEVTSTPQGATVYVDRRDLAPRGVTPTTIATQTGVHTIIVELDGHEPASREVEAALGQTRSVSLELTARPAIVRILSDPPGAEVRFDDEGGAVAGTTPLETTLPAGPHRVYLTLGDRVGREVFDAPPGGAISVPVGLGAPTTPGVVDVVADAPNAEVSVDGQVVGTAPVRRLRLAPGRHRISVTGDGSRRGWSEVVEVGPGHRLDLRVHLGSSMPRRRFGHWPTIGMALAGALAVAGGAIGGWALSLHADFREVRDYCEPRPQACGEGTTMREEAIALDERIGPLAIAADVLLGTAGALAITSFALMMLNREVPDESSFRIGVAPTSGGALATVDLPAGLVSFP